MLGRVLQLEPAYEPAATQFQPAQPQLSAQFGIDKVNYCKQSARQRQHLSGGSMGSGKPTKGSPSCANAIVGFP